MSSIILPIVVRLVSLVKFELHALLRRGQSLFEFELDACLVLIVRYYYR